MVMSIRTDTRVRQQRVPDVSLPNGKMKDLMFTEVKGGTFRVSALRSNLPVLYVHQKKSGRWAASDVPKGVKSESTPLIGKTPDRAFGKAAEAYWS